MPLDLLSDLTHEDEIYIRSVPFVFSKHITDSWLWSATHIAIYRLSNVSICKYVDQYAQCSKRFVQIFKETSTVDLEENDFVYRKSSASYTGCGKACWCKSNQSWALFGI